MNQKDTSAIIGAIDRALAVFEGNRSNRDTDASLYEELVRIRSELEAARRAAEPDTPSPPQR